MADPGPLITVRGFDAGTGSALATFQMLLDNGRVNVTALKKVLGATNLALNDPKGLLVYPVDSSGRSNFTFTEGSTVKMYRLARPPPPPVDVATGSKPKLAERPPWRSEGLRFRGARSGLS